MTSIPRCPVLQTEMSDPMRNVCGHTYSRAGIMGMLSSRRTVSCPVVGCRQLVSKDSLSEDVEMIVAIKRMQKGQQRTGGDDDDEPAYTQVD